MSFEKTIQGTMKCACCGSFVGKAKAKQFPVELLPMLANPFELGLDEKCSNKPVEELKAALETKFGKKMPEVKAEPQNVTRLPRVRKQNGISNREMIPMLKTAVDTDDLGGILSLRDDYSEIFESSIKYIGTKRQIKLQEILDRQTTVDQLAETTLCKKSMMGVLKIAIDAGELDKVQVIKKNQPEMFKQLLPFIGKDRQAKLQEVI